MQFTDNLKMHGLSLGLGSVYPDCLPKWQLPERKWESRSVWWKARLETGGPPLPQGIPCSGDTRGQRCGSVDRLWEGADQLYSFLCSETLFWGTWVA